MPIISKTAISAIMLIVLAAGVFAISADQAIAIVSVQNNYLMPNETASVSKGLITYSGEQYQIVAAQIDSKINAYIPIKNSTGEIATKDIEVRDLIKTTIIYSQISQLNQSVSAADWPFSYSTKSYFFDLSNDYGALMNSLITVKTELNKLGDSQSKQIASDAETASAMADDLAAESTKMAAQVDGARAFETDFLNNPDTNKITLYENYYDDYFSSVQAIKEKFSALDTKLTTISQGIGALENSALTVDQKRSYQALLAEPVNARRLPNFFSSTDELRTEIEGIFNAGKNSESFATTLASRKTRNDAWQMLYGQNAALIKLDSSFETLQKASTAVLSTDNVDLWANQDAVSALKTNWAGAESRFNNAEYDKAKDFATKAQSNIKLILADGTKPVVNNDTEIIKYAIAGLVIVVVVVFVLQNFVFKKKKDEGESVEEQYK